MTREGQRLEILIRALEARLKALASTGGLPMASHAATHAEGGSDPVDVTGLDGFPGDASKFLDGTGAFTTPTGGVTDHGALTGLGDDDHPQYILVDGSRAFTGDQSLGSHKLTNVTDPASAQDAATKAYVDGIAVNLGKRATVRVATTANITIATALNNGDSLDGITLATGDLVLVKDQSAPAENGVYVVGASPARFAEFDTYNEHPGALITVQEGTAGADTLWLCTSNAGGTLNTTAIAFSQISVTAGITQLTGDVTAGPGSGSQAATIANDAVTNAKAANMAQSTIKGRAAAAGTGDPTDLTPNEVSTVLDGATDPFLRTSALPGGASATRYASFGVTFDGMGLPLTAGMKEFGRYLHGNGTIVNVTILSTDAAATAGSIVIDIWKEGTFGSYPPTDADSITGGNEPELSSANHSEDTTLAGYSTVAMTRGDLWAFNIDSCTGITKCSIQVNVRLT